MPKVDIASDRRPLVTLELRAQAVKAMVQARQRAQLTEGLEVARAPVVR